LLSAARPGSLSSTPPFAEHQVARHPDADAVLELLDLDLVGVDLGPQRRLDRLLLLQHVVVGGLHDAPADRQQQARHGHRYPGRASGPLVRLVVPLMTGSSSS
jgi:hypothetical protein